MGYLQRMATTDPVLERFRAALAEFYEGRLERVVLYGSRARGDARTDSDYDIAIFLNDFTTCAQEFRRIARVEIAVLEDTGATVRAMPFRAGSWRDPSSPLMHEIRKDGLDL